MKLNLELGVSQQLKMTPQLQQAIRLLQLSTMELELEIRQAIETNPLLEYEDDPYDATEEAAAEPDTDAADDSEDAEVSSADETIPADLPVDSEWQDAFSELAYESPTPPASLSGGDVEQPDIAITADRPDTLTDHLLWQMSLTPFTAQDIAIAETIIDYIDDSGYLTITTADIAESFPPEEEIGVEEVDTVLHRIQHFDPPGVAARDLAECLRIQLHLLPAETTGRDAALELVNHLDLVGSRDFRQIMRLTGLGETHLGNALTLIQSLEPRPGNALAPPDTEYITPDVIVRRRDGRWIVELNPAIAPKLRVNGYYSGLIKRRDNSEQNTYLRNHLNEARWFIGSLRSRNETLLRVAECIVQRQAAFFDHGEQAMKPMVLHDIANELGMHESTISRVTNKKYMHTPNAIYELKYFFSSHVSTDDGGAASATSIRARIREMIKAEDKPLSDAKLAQMLQSQGINVARRTVAKYREAMNIPPSNERRKTVSAADING